jgi:hypothetical protein
MLRVPELGENIAAQSIAIRRRVVEGGAELRQPIARGRGNRSVGTRAERKKCHGK